MKDFWRYFWEGVGSISLFPPRLRKRPLSDEEARRADYEALKGDWEKVGEDLRRAIQRYEKERHEKGE